MKKTQKILMAVIGVIAVAAVIMAAVSISQPAGGQDHKELTIFAAASLKAAFTEIGSGYEAAHPGTTVAFNFDGSAKLKTQLLNGATADVFASADQTNMNGVAAAGLMDNTTMKAFANNRLVVIVPASNPAGIHELTDLAAPGLKIVIGDTTVPVGNYTRTVLALLTNSSEGFTDYKDKVMANVVSMESVVSNVVTKVSLGEADAGFVYTTDAASAGSNVGQIAIPDQYNVIAIYPIGVLAGSTESAEARTFVDYVLSAEGQAVLAKYGFITVS